MSVQFMVIMLLMTYAVTVNAQTNIDSLDQQTAHFNASLAVWRYQMAGTYGSPYGNLDIQSQLQMNEIYYGIELNANVDFGEGQGLEFIYLIQTSNGTKELATLIPDNRWRPFSYLSFRDVTISANIENTLFGIIYQNKIA